jgi:NADPH2:quinone reductase
MKAAVYYQTGAPEVFSYEDVPDPPCGPHEIAIDVTALSVEVGDVLNRAYGELASRPHVVGYMAAGVITEVGSEVSDRQIGQRVSTLNMAGSHAGKRVVGAITSWVLPDAVSFEDGACIPVTFGTAHDGLFEFGRLQAGETVLIQGGAGGVGIACIQLAKQAGATVYATASSDARLGRLTELGLDAGINYAEQDLVEEVMRLTGGKGVNVVVDPVGGRVLEQSIAATAPRGRVVSVGTASREFGRVDVSGLAMGNKSLTGVFLGAEIASRRVQNMIKGLFDSLAAGEISVLIDRTYPLAEAAAAHAYIESRQAVGRVLLIP